MHADDTCINLIITINLNNIESQQYFRWKGTPPCDVLFIQQRSVRGESLIHEFESRWRFYTFAKTYCLVKCEI